jgi:hypothetical protein
MKRVLGDEFSFFGNGDDTLLPAGAGLPGFAAKPADPVFGPSFLGPANTVVQAGALTDAAQAFDVLVARLPGTTGNSVPIAQNFAFIAPDVSPQPTESVNGGIWKTNATAATPHWVPLIGGALADNSAVSGVPSAASPGITGTLTVNFDDLTGDQQPISAGYNGFTWAASNGIGGTAFWATINGPQYGQTHGPNGYTNGTTSVPNVAFNGYQGDLEISRATDFDFVSGDFTAAWRNGLQVEVTGIDDGVAVYHQIFTSNYSAPTHAVLNMLSVDHVTIHTSGGTNPGGLGGDGVHVAMDNFVFDLGNDFWINEGPSPGINGQETVAPNNQINGAIQAIAVHPTDPNIMYVGSVNGGIWKTTNATSATPHWVPLTDNLASLSIGALEFDPTDATHQTLIAGIGATSSFRLHDTPFSGVLRSSDGGATWSQLGTAAANLGGESITSVAARGTTLLAAADNGWSVQNPGLGKGLFRSTDSGANWTLISDGAHGLPNLTDVSDIVGDPLNSNVLYAAVTGPSGGVFKSTDTGLTWTNITSGIGIIGGTTDKIELAVHHGATNTAVFATVDNGGILSGVFRSLNGGSFVALNVPSGGTQGEVHNSIAADPANPNIVYVGFGGGSTNYLTRIDASQPSGSQITKISGGSFGSPHVDPREMQIDPNGNLILGTDGGLFRLTTPTANTGVWSAIVGDMSVFELHSIAYDHVSNIIMAGAQDNGTLFQLTPGGATWDHPGFGDGGDVVIDDVSLAGSGQSIRYFSSQFLGGWTRQVYDSANHLVSTISLASIPDGTFTTPVELNVVDPTRLLVGGSGHIYTSSNQGTSLTPIANVAVNGIYDFSPNGGGLMVYGGFQGGIANADLIYAASGSNVLKQTASGGGFTSTSPGGSTIRGVTDNPTNWATVFAIDDNQIFASTNAGGIWADVTANLTAISAADFRSIEYVHGLVDDALVVGTSSGVFYARTSQLGGAASWSKFGGNMPDVIVYDLEYDAADNVLVAGTMGRGAWLVNSATTNLGIDVQAGSVSISDMSISEGNSGTKVMTFTVTRSGGTAAFAVNFATADNSATTADNDYVANAGTLNFGVGVNTQTISVTINGDTRFESDEAFFVNLSGATNGAAISDSQGIGALSNDDHVPHDFNPDGKSEVFLQNTNGSTYIWQMNGLAVAASSAGQAVDASWHVVSTKSDLDADGRSDIVLQNTSGATYFWEMNGFGVKAFGAGPTVDPSWHIVGTGDLDADGKGDIVLQNTSGATYFWEMNGLGVKASGAGPTVDPSWHIAATGDLDGDGNSDIILQNTSGATYFWEMNGLGVKASGAGPTVDPSWHIVGTADLDGDGKSDIILQNTNGGTYFWEMNGLGVKAFGAGPTVDPSWHIAATGDLNADGKGDIILQNTSGATYFWEMDGLGVQASGAGPIVDPSWHII